MAGSKKPKWPGMHYNIGGMFNKPDPKFESLGKKGPKMEVTAPQEFFNKTREKFEGEQKVQKFRDTLKSMRLLSENIAKKHKAMASTDILWITGKKIPAQGYARDVIAKMVLGRMKLVIPDLGERVTLQGILLGMHPENAKKLGTEKIISAMEEIEFFQLAGDDIFTGRAGAKLKGGTIVKNAADILHIACQNELLKRGIRT